MSNAFSKLTTNRNLPLAPRVPQLCKRSLVFNYSYYNEGLKFVYLILNKLHSVGYEWMEKIIDDATDEKKNCFK